MLSDAQHNTTQQDQHADKHAFTILVNPLLRLYTYDAAPATPAPAGWYRSADGQFAAVKKGYRYAPFGVERML